MDKFEVNINMQTNIAIAIAIPMRQLESNDSNTLIQLNGEFNRRQAKPQRFKSCAWMYVIFIGLIALYYVADTCDRLINGEPKEFMASTVCTQFEVLTYV